MPKELETGLRILLIDDNPDDRMMIIRGLQKEFPQPEIRQVFDAQGVTKALQDGDFNLVITDFQLKWTDGLEILRAVKATRPDCPVVMFTGTGSEEIAVEAMKGGLDDYILKSPQHFHRLAVAVRKVLEDARGIARRRQAEENQRLRLEILQLLTRVEGQETLIDEMLRVIKQAIGIEALGLRIRSGEDFPYYYVNGYSELFVEKEKFLCARTQDGTIIRNDDGLPVLECTCGLVLSGKADLSLPFFSQAGSFWTNEASKLLELTPEEDPRTTPRNNCIYEGYESIALIPLKSDQEIIGSLHLSDRRKGLFTIERIRFLEEIAVSVGIALCRRQDQEALQETEKRLEAAFEQSNDGITFLKGGVILYVNKKFLEIFGYDDVKEVVGKSPAITIHPEDRERVTSYANVRETDQLVPRRYTFKGIRKNGGIVYIEVSAAPITYSGDIISMVILRDVTENKMAIDKIEASLKEKEFLLREIHHRVKNNLQVIHSLLNLQAGKIKDSQYREVFKESQNRIRAMALVHEKLYQSLDFSRIDIDDYLRNLSTRLFHASQVSPDKVRLRLEVEQIQIGIDKAVPLGLLLNELISNALKHAFPGEREGEIRVSFARIDGGMIRLTVGNNGIAFPEEMDFRKTESMGFLLVMAQVEQLDGTIELNREGGTEFRITFPEGKD